MIILDKERIFTNEDIGYIENSMLNGILACRTSEAVEAAITYSRFLSKTGLTNENYPLFIKVLEIGNHWVIDALVGDRDPFLFLSSIQPNRKISQAMFALLAERHPGGMYPKTLSIILGVLQALYNSPEDGYNIYSLSVSDLNSLGKHLDEEKGQEDSLNRVILDILDKIGQLERQDSIDAQTEEIAIHSSKIRNFFFDANKKLKEVIPEVLLVRMRYQDFEVAPRNEIDHKEEKGGPAANPKPPKAGDSATPPKPKAEAAPKKAAPKKDD
ncbi:hypothetical protein [Spirochaeta cellobiosiphila]|uniref:hypothetical protein n=1 Tax=Spirochaeta cellobiosiphila TaxID=504483 RepID=UPI0003FD19A9|nr:hypothetical protein [Spirochaeta cellobiosiphila]